MPVGGGEGSRARAASGRAFHVATGYYDDLFGMVPFCPTAELGVRNGSIEATVA